MGASSRNKGSYHERWWCNWFTEKGCDARRQPLSGALGGDFKSDISIDAEQGRLVAESKYQATGRGFSFLNKDTQNTTSRYLFLKQKQGQTLYALKQTTLWLKNLYDG